MGKDDEELGNMEALLDKDRKEIKRAVKGDTKSRCGLTLWLAGALLNGNH